MDGAVKNLGQVIACCVRIVCSGRVIRMLHPCAILFVPSVNDRGCGRRVREYGCHDRANGDRGHASDDHDRASDRRKERCD